MTTLPRMSTRKADLASLQFENSKLRQRVRRLEDELRRYKEINSSDRMNRTVERIRFDEHQS